MASGCPKALSEECEHQTSRSDSSKNSRRLRNNRLGELSKGKLTQGKVNWKTVTKRNTGQCVNAELIIRLLRDRIIDRQSNAANARVDGRDIISPRILGNSSILGCGAEVILEWRSCMGESGKVAHARTQPSGESKASRSEEIHNQDFSCECFR